MRALYDFDRSLRLLVAEGVSTLEIYTRTQIAHYIATKYGPFGHLQASAFQNANKAIY
ncbi:MAG: Abi family protein [Thermoguttaceae bacterium]|nr:Abi family protein [Thermoguttaceae bacterium]MBQ8362389.1 Abi family protein [Thermoguttaceae bacterium]MBQ9127505.1 Abi family protein [Thermoguttaceae bacterium]